MWEAFLDSLREDTELYNLTREELENLVSVVVREKGFPKLVGLRRFRTGAMKLGLAAERLMFSISSMRWTRCGSLGDS